jgi:hypothetical protein
MATKSRTRIAKGNLVGCVREFSGRTTPPPRLSEIGKTTTPFRQTILVGTTGIVNGRAVGAEDLWDVSFEGPNNQLIRVETETEDIERITP